MAINSEIYICKGINLTKELNNILNYNENQMKELCISKAVASKTNFQFIKTSDNIISTPFSYNDCINCNYMMFQNPRYNNKWFFAFIDEVRYISDGVTQIVFTVDSWHTWYSNLNLKACYVNREHTNNDTIGANTIEEGLELGECVVDGEIAVQDMNSFPYLGVLTNYIPSGKGSYKFSGGAVYNGTVFGSALIVFASSNIEGFVNFVNRANEDGQVENIQEVFAIPFQVIEAQYLTQFNFDYDNKTYSGSLVAEQGTIFSDEWVISKPYTFSDYKPKNNKLFVFPYNYLYMTNNQGENNIYHIEDFGNNNCHFENQFAVSVGR